MSAPTVLVIQHEDDCPPALLGEWLVEAGCALDVRRPYADRPLPPEAELAAYAGMLVLGGSMDADDDAGHPWLTGTRELLRAAVREGVPVLGVCLGHQLTALALGGEVGRNPRGRQVGLLDVGWRPAAQGDPLFGRLASPRRGVQWNQDVVTRLPAGAELLAETPHGEAQVVRFAPHAWGVQLHPEVDEVVLRSWLDSDDGSHDDHSRVERERQRTLVTEVAAARAELERWWRPLAVHFAGAMTAARADRESGSAGARR